MTNSKIEKELNSKILKITMKIQEQYPEMSKFLEEMPVTVPSEENPEITIHQLRTYYDSLEKMLAKYILEKPEEKESTKEKSKDKPNPKDPNEIQGFPNKNDSNPGKYPKIKH